MSDIETLKAELEDVEAAIKAAYTGSEYEIESGGTRRRLKRQPLNVLLARKAQLETSIARLEGGGSRGVRHGMPV